MQTDGRNDAVYRIAGQNYEKLLSFCEALNDEGYWEEPSSCLKRTIIEMLDLYVQSVLVHFAVYCNRLNETEQRFILNLTENTMISWNMDTEVPDSVISGAKRVSTSPPILLQLCGLRDKEKSTKISGQFFDAFINIILSLSHLNHGLRYRDMMAKGFLEVYFDKVQYFLDEAQRLMINKDYLDKKTGNDRIEDVYGFNLTVKKSDDGDDGFEWEDTEVNFNLLNITGDKFENKISNLADARQNASHSAKNEDENEVVADTAVEVMEASQVREVVADTGEEIMETAETKEVAGTAEAAEEVLQQSVVLEKQSVSEEHEVSLQPEVYEEQSVSEEHEVPQQLGEAEEAKKPEEPEKPEEGEIAGETEIHEGKAEELKEDIKAKEDLILKEELTSAPTDVPTDIETLKKQQKENFLNHKLQEEQIKAIQEEIKAIKEKKSLQKIEGFLQELNQMVGLSQVKEEVKSLINLIRMRKLRISYEMPNMDMSYHMVFTGNPGTGKTTVARLIAKIYKELGVVSKGTLVETDRAGLVAGYVGQTALKVTEVVNKAIGGILFIDEAYSLTNSSVPNDFGTEAIDTLVKLMEDNRNDLVVIVAGYKKEMKEFLSSNTGLISRFNKFIEFPDYSLDELTDILKVMAEKSGVEIEEDAVKLLRESLDDFSDEQLRVFGNARGIRNTFEKIIQSQADRVMATENPTKEDLGLILEEDVKKVLKS